MNFFLVIAVSLIAIFSVGIAYSQTDQIPGWIKVSVEFWVDGNTSEQEFISAMEYLIDNKIIVIPRIAELEQEVMLLEQKLENIQKQEESNESTPEQSSKTGLAPPGSEEQEESNESTPATYVVANKKAYTLGDTIQITGKKDVLNPEDSRQNLKGEYIPWNEQLTIYMYFDDTSTNSDRNVVGIICYIEENVLTDCSSGGDYSFSVSRSKVVSEDGAFEFGFTVADYYEPGIYYVVMLHSAEGYQELIGSAKSMPFLIQTAPDEEP